MGCKLGFLFYLGLRKNGIWSGRVSLVSYSSTFYISAYSCVIDIDSLLASGGLWEMVFYWEILPPTYLSKICVLGTFLVFLWLRLFASTSQGMGLITGQGTKIPHAAQHGPKSKMCLFLDTLLKPLRLPVDHRKEPVTLLRFFRIFTVWLNQQSSLTFHLRAPTTKACCSFPKEAAVKLSCMSSASSISLKV